eukprot:CAMPEP_0194408534 /NCGR_PEP_ID=MMETSP0176-20130528/6371_1 /TAXON_ID=216777 /ORGANISM="Proboscia alata, Strain PI-D3" /LENGTH=57 /DNA_ID=CAMNT_0039208645 /DNA_START=800 /DNA_END=973 /DNA_ORIENTATION=-
MITNLKHKFHDEHEDDQDAKIPFGSPFEEMRTLPDPNDDPALQPCSSFRGTPNEEVK